MQWDLSPVIFNVNLLSGGEGGTELNDFSNLLEF